MSNSADYIKFLLHRLSNLAILCKRQNRNLRNYIKFLLERLSNVFRKISDGIFNLTDLISKWKSFISMCANILFKNLTILHLYKHPQEIMVIENDNEFKNKKS